MIYKQYRKNVNSKLEYKVEDFLRDDKFVSYALNISSEARTDRESLPEEYDKPTGNAALAMAILNGEDTTYCLTSRESEDLKQRILNTISKL